MQRAVLLLFFLWWHPLVALVAVGLYCTLIYGDRKSVVGANVVAARELEPIDSIEQFTSSYYATYAGHKAGHLFRVLRAVGDDRSFVYLAGDSSLDNKAWLGHAEAKPPCNGYGEVLKWMKPDVCYHLNAAAEGQSRKLVAINAAVEASCVRDRATNLLPQDHFIRDTIRTSSIWGMEAVSSPRCHSN